MSKSKEVIISPMEKVRVTKMGHIIEVQHIEKQNRKANIRKLDSDSYVDLKTGEIKEFQKSINRSQNVNSLRQTFKKLRYLINNNFSGNGNELFITLTYGKKKKAYDPKELYPDFDKFMKRLRYEYKGQTTIDYINVVEPHEKGDFHCHVLLRFNDLDKVFMENSKLADLWGLGFVKIRSLKGVDNIGAYLSAYLADIEITDDKTIKEDIPIEIKIVDGQEKKFIKGGRLHLYPSGTNIHRKSKGIVEPEREEMPFKDIKKVVGSTKPHYTQSLTIQDGDYNNKIQYLQYNTKR